MFKERNQYEEQYLLVSNKLNSVLKELEDYKIRQNKILQNSDYIKELLEIINSSKGKEIVLASTGIITSSQAINSEKWTYLGVCLEE